jgi:hypothetical protein
MDLEFTRYLYSKIEVKQSMLLAMLEHNSDEALFWAYELYFSGPSDACFEYAANIYEDIYSFDNPSLRPKIQQLWDEWVDDNNKHWILGTIIMTLASRNYRLSIFMETYFGVKCIDQQPDRQTSNLIVYLKEKHIEKYKTIVPDIPRNYLKLGCKYPIRKESNELFATDPSEFENEFRYHWLYYCKNTPFWYEKINECNGEHCDETKTIKFPDDDFQDKFYDAWGIEPDEQPREFIERCIGKKDVTQLSIAEFCKKYGASVVMKKLRIRTTDTVPITNSIEYK